MPNGFAAGRLFGVDLARGLALLGMFVAHVARVDGELLVDGRSSILFATVAGVSLGLMSGGAEPAQPGARAGIRTGIALRAFALIAIGLLLTAVASPPIAVILDYYGFAFLLVLPLLFASRAVLAIAAAAVVAVMPAVVGALTAAAESGAFDPASLNPLVQLVALWTVYGAYPMGVWVAFLLVGLLVSRCDLRSWRTRAWAAAAGSVAALAGYLPVLAGADASAHSSTLFEVIGSGGVAVLVIAACTAIGELPGVAGRIVRVVGYPVAAAGSMVLSLYVAHALLLPLWVPASYYDPYPSWVMPALVVGALLIGTLWRRFVGSGPLEAGLAWLTRLARGRHPAATAPSLPDDVAR